MKWIALAILLASAPAWAQSKKYPPEPVDRDLERERQSRLWDEALSPETKSYAELVREAKHRLDERTPDDTILAMLAIETLSQAIELLPKATDAYVLRGDAYLAVKNWAQCADDLQIADDKTGGSAACTAKIDESCIVDRSRLRRELAICQSRAGRYADAERTFMRAASNGSTNGELWMRLGEVRLAMGKLEEGIAALEVAVDLTPDGMQEALHHWLLALAYDRRRQPSEVATQIELALRFDSQFSALQYPEFPLLGLGESEYMRGLAWRTIRPEYALVYFRRYVALAPDSPWRKRADEHVRELTAIDLPATLVREGGTASLDLEAARAIAKKAMPAMRTCMVKLPYSVFLISITKTGARSELARDRPIYRVPPAGVTIPNMPFTPSGEVKTEDIVTAQRCLQPLAEKLALPAVKDRDTYYKASFYVTAP
ncbi:MAG: Tetratricopeptide 2 repeat protein [Myxococcales bacterium]|nr:Tetratricopeptide 2 repeat protein [Myxococcales bacterium]